MLDHVVLKFVVDFFKAPKFKGISRLSGSGDIFVLFQWSWRFVKHQVGKLGLEIQKLSI
jgi:hypothetical protein